MLENYVPILIFIGVGLFFGVAPMLMGWLLGPSNPDSAKLSPYECGFEAFEDSRMKFDVRYYLVAILFIIFDLEIAFDDAVDEVGEILLVHGQIHQFVLGELVHDVRRDRLDAPLTQPHDSIHPLRVRG